MTDHASRLDPQERELFDRLSEQHRSQLERIRVLESQLAASKRVVFPLVYVLVAKQRELDERMATYDAVLPDMRAAVAEHTTMVDALSKALSETFDLQQLNEQLASCSDALIAERDEALSERVMLLASIEEHKDNFAQLFNRSSKMRDEDQEAIDVLRREVHTLRGDLHAKDIEFDHLTRELAACRSVKREAASLHDAYDALARNLDVDDPESLAHGAITYRAERA
jgi:chromosome segregation ATPase